MKNLRIILISIVINVSVITQTECGCLIHKIIPLSIISRLPSEHYESSALFPSSSFTLSSFETFHLQIKNGSSFLCPTESKQACLLQNGKVVWRKFSTDCEAYMLTSNYFTDIAEFFKHFRNPIPTLYIQVPLDSDEDILYNLKQSAIRKKTFQPFMKVIIILQNSTWSLYCFFCLSHEIFHFESTPLIQPFQMDEIFRHKRGMSLKLYNGNNATGIFHTDWTTREDWRLSVS